LGEVGIIGGRRDNIEMDLTVVGYQVLDWIIWLRIGSSGGLL